MTKPTFTALLSLSLPALVAASGCSTVRSIVDPAAQANEVKPIGNPFYGYSNRDDRPDTMIVRSKNGNGAVEVEVPRAGDSVSDFVIPISPTTKVVSTGSRAPASISGVVGEETAEVAAPTNRSPSLSDREITRTFPQGLMEDDPRRRDIEDDLGLVRSSDDPERSRSYLASIDYVKRLYKAGRYEAALLETDALLKSYPTDPRLYGMRGTLLDRVGQPDLALSAWKQALRFDPKDESLRRFIERKEQKRGLAGK